MKFNICNTLDIYKQLLNCPDDKKRGQLFTDQLVQPFVGLAQVMGGRDPLATFRQWGMYPEQFTGESAGVVATKLAGLEQANAWERAGCALAKGWQAFAPFHHHFPESEITFALMYCDLSAVPLQRGYSGFGAIPGWIMTIYDLPTPYNLEHIEACTVHELHHNLLRHISPVNMNTWTVGDYMVMEGLAESFAAELYGEGKIGFWVTDFDQTRHNEACVMLKQALNYTGFDVLRSYIFGDEFAGWGGLKKVGVPAFAGYAIGYQVVQAYLKKTGKTVAEATFVPWQEIISVSDYL